MGYSPYSEHRPSAAVSKVRRVEHYDATDADDLKTRKKYEQAREATADELRKQGEPKKRSFAALLKKR
jgi:hypothetical protein